MSVQAKGQQGPPNCHCISAVPAGIGRNTQALDKNIKWIAIILLMRSVYGQVTPVRQKLRLETALNAPLDLCDVKVQWTQYKINGLF